MLQTLLYMRCKIYVCVGVDVRKDREKSDGVSLHISKHEPRLLYSQHVDQM